jgi:hypothetical protein
MLNVLASFKGVIANLIGIATWIAVVVATDWSLWVSLPVGFVAACVAALAWGYIIAGMAARQRGF